MTNESASNQIDDHSAANPPSEEDRIPDPVLQSFPVRYAGFWMRFWAYLLDLIVVGSIGRLLINPLFRALDISLSEFNMFAPISIASAVIFYLYFVLMTKYFKQTLGKMVFGLKVIDLKSDKLSWGTVLFREWIGRFISATVIIGYCLVAFLPKKQGLHDLFTDTTVIHTER
ncbi:RDD family protein [Bacillus sp. S3]|uniref:RDD family protein n=1 Tax=Bacillus sp. S3 TaxID=486398 RepID=UPI00118CB9DF|nr:RDD family protein [Bacillus sp. S3]